MNSEIVTRAWALREGGQVQRMHTVPIVGDASVARHSYNMAVLAWLIYPRTEGGLAPLIIACLLHDVAERWVGDTPAPAKYTLNPRLAQELHVAGAAVEEALDMQVGLMLTNKLRAWLKALDMLEYLMHCDTELALGNRHVEQGRANALRILQAASGTWLPSEVTQFLLGYVGWERTAIPGLGDVMQPLKEAVR